MFDTKNLIFRKKPIIMVKNFYPFLEVIGFSMSKRNVDTFSLFVWQPLEQPNAKNLTIFVKQNITRLLKFNVEIQSIMWLQIYQTASINKTGRIGDWKS